MKPRHTLLAAILITAFAATPLHAQPWPNKPLRLIIPFPGAGGAADVTGRLAGQKISEAIGQPVVIENRPGGGGNIGIETAARAAPDGYTLLVTAPSLTISPSLYSKLGFDPVKDFAPITLLAEIPNVITIRQALPANTLKEFIEYGRANPGKLNFGTSGLGTATHLATVLFLSQANVTGVNVVYKGSSQALVAMIGNEVDLVVIGPPAALPHIQAGRVKALAVMRNARLPSLPQVPTTREAGVANTEVTTWYGLLAPAGTPREIVRRLNDIWAKAAATPEMREKMQNTGSEVIATTPEQFAEMIRAEVPRWRKVIADANLKVE
jgi:tripartite-type tricarboxylate transporter receptor subunit TctC